MRTIGLHPNKQYEFPTDESFRRPWAFLPHRDRTTIIGQQLTYLAFHERLKDNLKHAKQAEPTAKDWSELVFNLPEGFFKTDVLLYASICEAALFSVLKRFFEIQGPASHDDLKRCFEKVELKTHFLHPTPVEMLVGTTPRKGKLALTWEQPKACSDGEVHFAPLVAAGQSVGVYPPALRKELDGLRDDRNAIHLAKHIDRKSDRTAFDKTDREAAKKTTEKLRVALEAFVAANKVK